MAIEYLVPTANASTATGLTTNDYTLIDEGAPNGLVTDADGSVNNTIIDDWAGASAVWSSLSSLSGAISSVNSATFRVRARLVVPSNNDDTGTWQFRLTVGGSTYDITWSATGDNNAGFANRTIPVGTFTKAQYDAATVTLTQTAFTKTKGYDGMYIDIDAFELEVDYVGAVPVNVPVTGVAATGAVGAVTVTTGVGITVLIDTVIVDTFFMDGPTTDSQAVWTDDANAADGSTSTFAYTSTVGSASSNALQLLTNTTIPTSGGTVTKVRSRLYGAVDSSDAGNAKVIAYFGSTYQAPSSKTSNVVGADYAPDWSAYNAQFAEDWFNWTTLSSSYVKFYAQDFLGTLAGARVYRAELEVTHSNTLATSAVGAVTVTTGVGITVPAGSPIEPDSVGDMVLWLDATDLTTLWQESSRTTQVSSPSDEVGAWDDKSGGGNHWTQGTATKLPLYKEDFNTSYPSVWFDGINDYLIGAMSEVSSDWTFLLVLDLVNTPATGEYLLDFQTGRINIGIDSSDEFFYYSNPVFGGTTLPVTPSVVTIRADSTTASSGTIEINRTETASGQAVSRALGGTQSLGSLYTGTLNVEGYVSSLLIYRGNLANADIATAEDYLADRYGITGFTPPDRTGVEATGAVGAVTVSVDANVPVTGVEATGAVSSVVAPFLQYTYVDGSGYITDTDAAWVNDANAADGNGATYASTTDPGGSQTTNLLKLKGVAPVADETGELVSVEVGIRYEGLITGGSVQLYYRILIGSNALNGQTGFGFRDSGVIYIESHTTGFPNVFWDGISGYQDCEVDLSIWEWTGTFDEGRFYNAPVKVISLNQGARGDANVYPTGVAATASVGAVTVEISTTVLLTPPTEATYYFDAHTLLNDNNAVWTNDANAADGSTSTYAETTANGASDYLALKGTTATDLGSGVGISSVKGRIYGEASGHFSQLNAQFYDLFQNVGNTSIFESAGLSWSNYGTLNSPNGWTWAEVIDSTVRFYGLTGDTFNWVRAYRAEYLVEYGAGLSAIGAVGAVTVDASSPSVNVPVTGVEATSAVDTVTVTGDSNVTLTGVAATGEVDSVTVAAKSNVVAIGSASTGETGSPTVEAKSNTSIVGLAAAAAVGAVSAGISVVVAVVGLAAAGAVGDVNASGDANVLLTGSAATGQVDQVDIDAQAVVPILGLGATGAVGQVTVDEGSVPVDVPVTGQEATGAVGDLTVTGDANVPISGLEGTGEVGQVTVDAVIAIDVPATGSAGLSQVGQVTVDAVVSVDVPLTGSAGTGQVGDALVTGDANIILTGIEATGEVGQVTVTSAETVLVDGSAGTGQVGDPAVTGDALAILTGSTGTGQVGLVTVVAGNDITVPIIGLEGTGQVGDLIVSGDALVALTGSEETGEVGSVSVALPAVVPVTGSAGTGEVGDVTVTGEALVVLTGSAGSGEVGSVQVSTQGNVTVTLDGVFAAGAVGDLAVTGDALAILTGSAGAGQVGQVTITVGGAIIVPVTCPGATGYVGQVRVTTGACTWVGTVEILRAAFDWLDAFAYSPQPAILWPGLQSNPPGAGMWIEPILVPGETVNVVWDNCANVDTRGYVQMRVYYRPGQGQLAPSELADALIDYFPKGLVLGPVRVNMRAWQLPAVVEDPSKIYIPVMVSYQGLT